VKPAWVQAPNVVDSATSVASRPRTIRILLDQCEAMIVGSARRHLEVPPTLLARADEVVEAGSS
jgi:hypothetical protein